MAVTNIDTTHDIINYCGDSHPKVISQNDYDDYRDITSLGAISSFKNSTFLIKE